MLVLYVQCSGSKFVAFTASVIFEIIALKTAGEFWLAWPV